MKTISNQHVSISKLAGIILTAILVTISTETDAQISAPTIRVMGEATVKGNPELLVVRIPVNAKNESYAACSTALTTHFSNLKTSLKNAGIDEHQIFSNDMRINEHYEYNSGGRTMMGYEGSINAIIRTPNTTESLQIITGILADDKFKFGYSLNYEFSENQKTLLQDEAMTKAIAEAKSNATALANGLNLKLGTVLEINYQVNESQPSPWVKTYAMESKSNAASDVELNPEEQSLTKRVEVVWVLKTN